MKIDEKIRTTIRLSTESHRDNWYNQFYKSTKGSSLNFFRNRITEMSMCSTKIRFSVK